MLNLSFVDSDSDKDEFMDINDIPDSSDDNNHETEHSDYENDDSNNDNANMQAMLEELVDESELDSMLNDFQVDVPNIVATEKLTGPLYLVTWLCLFLALWQYTFSITDTALEHLIKFIKAFLSVLGQRSEELTKMAAFMPPSLYMFFKHIGCDSVNYEKYVICIKCFKLYTWEDCITRIQGIPESEERIY